MSERTSGRDHRDADDRALHVADHLTAHPTRARRLSGRSRRALPADRQGQPAHPAASAAGAALDRRPVAAYACNANSGLQTVQVGIATLDADGFIDFSDSQQLSINELTLTATKPVPVAGDTFDSAPRPKPLLDVVDVDKTATGHDENGTTADGPQAK